VDEWLGMDLVLVDGNMAGWWGRRISGNSSVNAGG
jgi:hypothetical protein